MLGHPHQNILSPDACHLLGPKFPVCKKEGGTRTPTPEELSWGSYCSMARLLGI